MKFLKRKTITGVSGRVDIDCRRQLKAESLRSRAMTTKPDGRLIAIPSSHTALGESLVELLLLDECRMALGSSPAHFRTLDARIDGHERVYCQPVDLDRPASVHTFFQIAFAQLGAPDVIILEVRPLKTKRRIAELIVEVATQRLLHCLDAALPFVGRDLHLVVIAPTYGLAAIPIATAYLGAKFAAMAKPREVRVRMSVVSPRAAPDDASLAKAIVQIIKEPQYPDVIETVLSPKDKRRDRMVRARMSCAAKIDAGLT